MATGRMLKKNISKSEKFAALKSDKARLLYLLVLPHLDRAGRLDANPKLIKGQVIPLLSISTSVIQGCLENMHNIGLISLYDVNGAQFLEYTKFTDFQTLRDDREAESEIPPAPAELPRDSGSAPAEVKLSKVKLSKGKYTSEFEIFWKKFKGRYDPENDRYIKVRKFEAFQEWQKLNIEDQRKAWRVADRVKGKYVPDACRWLKQRLFDDFFAAVV